MRGSEVIGAAANERPPSVQPAKFESLVLPFSSLEERTPVKIFLSSHSLISGWRRRFSPPLPN